MGAWSDGSFDNDGALDFTMELEGSDGPAAVRDALTLPEGYLEVDTGQRALAAAEIVAALAGHPSSGLPASVVAWVAAHPGVGQPSDPALAVAAIERVIGSDSEIADLWDDAGPEALADWKTHVEDLRSRLTVS